MPPERRGCRRTTLSGFAALVALLATSGPGSVQAAGGRSGLCATLRTGDADAPRLLVFSAFPAELAPLVAAADVEETVSVGDRSYYLATLHGVRVVLGLLGIGMLNATDRTRTALARFHPAGVVVSGVAGGPRIGDVVVPAEWVRSEGRRAISVNAALLELVRQSANAATLERCTPVPPGSENVVCLPHVPAVIIGGRGESGDSYGDEPFRCIPGGGPILGCELPAPRLPGGTRARAAAIETQAEDQETAAVAQVAARKGIPCIAFRAASDGGGDPLGLPGFPAQFLAYYQLAADNAAAGALAFLDRLAHLGADDADARRVCALLARRRWRRASAMLARLEPSSPTARAAP